LSRPLVAITQRRRTPATRQWHRTGAACLARALLAHGLIPIDDIRHASEAMPDDNLLPLLIYIVLVVLTVGGLLALSHVLGQRHREPATGAPFESGIVHIGSGWARIPVRFYLVAVLFVIFDLEAAFIFAWAVAARQAGWPGYIEILVFIGILAAALAYLWRVGALDWHRTPRADRP
jgi:NADH-quinone oxidoreductase subunit A